MSATQPPENTNPQQPGPQPDGQGPGEQPGGSFGPGSQPGGRQAAPGGGQRAPSGGLPQFGPDGGPTQSGAGPWYGPGAPQSAQGGASSFGPGAQPPYPPGGQQPDPAGRPAFPPGGPQFGPDGQPLPPGAYPPAGAGFQPPVAAPAKGGTLKRILTSVGIAIIAIVVGILWRTGVFDSPSLKVGDCVQQTGSDSVKAVDCGSADAQYRVLGIKQKQSQVSARLLACSDWPETTSVYWEGRNTSSGTVYCLLKL